MNTIKLKNSNILMVAHRGLSGIEKENTNAAFVAACNRSYYGIECDIRKTADGKWIVCHDENLGRVSGEFLNINEISFELAQSIVLFNKNGKKDRKDLHPSSLEEYLNICKKYEKHCVIELKGDFPNEDINQIIDIIKKYEYLENVTFISFYYDNLLKIRNLIATQSVQFLFNKFTDEKLNRLAADKIDVDIDHIILNKEIIDKIHSVGLKINCWTVDSKERAEELADLGVDFITTNILE